MAKKLTRNDVTVAITKFILRMTANLRREAQFFLLSNGTILNILKNMTIGE